MTEERHEDDDSPDHGHHEHHGDERHHEHHEHREHHGHHEGERHHEHHEHREHKEFKIGKAETIVMVIGAVLLLMVLYNAAKISTITPGTGFSVLPSVSASDILPTGVPDIYGEELGVNFDDVSAATPQKADATIRVMSNLDRTITLTGADLDRYIAIVSQISCEFCCGAKSIIRSDGSSACGCAHSYAMRGLAKYLITEHGNEYSDDEILEEMGKWKVLFFPGVHETKAAVLKEQGIKVNYVNLASNKYRGIEKGTSSSGGMVGGC